MCKRICGISLLFAGLAALAAPEAGRPIAAAQAPEAPDRPGLSRPLAPGRLSGFRKDRSSAVPYVRPAPGLPTTVGDPAVAPLPWWMERPPGPPLPGPKLENLPPPRLGPLPYPESSPRDLGELRWLKQELEKQRAALAAERDGAPKNGSQASTGELDTLRKRFAVLKKKAAEKKEAPADDEPRKPARPAISLAPVPAESAAGVDRLAMGDALFLAGDHHKALQAYRMVELASLPEEERLPVQYMIATCLRKLGKDRWAEAEEWYAQVAASQADKTLAELAQWQLSNLRWQRGFEAKVQTIQGRLQELEKP